MASKVVIKCANCDVLYSFYKSYRVRIREEDYTDEDGDPVFQDRIAYICPACKKRAGYKRW